MKIKKCLAALLVGVILLPCSTSWANSRSATIRVSCTILPALEFSSVPMSQRVNAASFQSQASTPTEPRKELSIVSSEKRIFVNTNLGSQYRLNEKMVGNKNGNIKLYSLTAL